MMAVIDAFKKYALITQGNTGIGQFCTGFDELVPRDG